MTAAPTPAREATRLSELSPQQWKSGLAAWLGWMFDGLELHLYTLVATPLVVQLLAASSAADPDVKEKAAYIQAAFLIGWAVGGAFFGRLGDLLGRSRTLALTVLTYACCTGLCAFAQTWWQLMIFRFIAAIGIGGEWAVGASLLSETWPRAWRPWIAAVLQCGVHLGILVAAGAVYLLNVQPGQERWVFLLGVVPALLVFWIRKQVPEPEDWQAAAAATAGPKPGIADLFRGAVAPITWKTMIVCALGLSAWWLFIFWQAQHVRKLLVDSGLPPGEVTRQVSVSFFFTIAITIFGTLFAGWLAQRTSNKRAIVIMFFGLFAFMAGAFVVPRGFGELAWFWLPAVGFCSGGFGLFTMYMPPLFPTLLRTTGAGFCYNIGRVAAAAAAVIFGWLAPVGDLRMALFYSSFLALAATLWSFWLPPDAQEA